MADDKKKRKILPTMQTPRWGWSWPKLNRPDYGNEKFPKKDGEFSLQARVQADDPKVQALLAKLQPLYDAAIADGIEEAKNLKIDARKRLEKKNGTDLVEIQPLFKTLYDEETEKPTGEIEFKFSMKASVTFDDKKTGKAITKHFAPGIFDAKGKVMAKAPDIYGGTEGIIAFRPNPYFIPGTGLVGLSLKLEGVQILDLVQGGEKTAKGLGFAAQDGYEYDDASTDAQEEDEEDVGNGTEEPQDADF
jgi:hypothetical protein